MDYEALRLINPAVAVFLFMISAGAMARFLREMLTSMTHTDLILLVNRYSIIRVVLSGVIALWLLSQLLLVLSSDTAYDLLDLYQNKFLWTVLLVGIGAYRFMSPSE